MSFGFSRFTEQSAGGELGWVDPGRCRLPRSTFFWAGKTFAPNLLVPDPTAGGEEKNIQTFLQERFLAMFEVLVDSLEGVQGVLGFEVSGFVAGQEARRLMCERAGR